VKPLSLGKDFDMAKYELTSGKNVVYLGDVDFTMYAQPLKNSFMFSQYLLSGGRFKDLYFPNHHPKLINKTLHEYFGSKIYLRFPAAMYNTFIRDNIPYEAHFAVSYNGYHWKKFDTAKVNVAVLHNHLVQQAVKDKTLNVLPLMLHKRMDTQQLKAHYGKGLWKKLANTSKTRMKYLAPLIDGNEEWVSIRSGILEKLNPAMNPLQPQTATLIAAKIAPTVSRFGATNHIVRDTLILAQDHGEEVNYNWSLARWSEEHNRLAAKKYESNFSKKPFTDVVTYEEDGYTFTLLNTEFDIALEGTSMRHCVASYAKRASQGNYQVFKVEGKERATLGLYYRVARWLVNDDTTEITFDQCYGYRNSSVSERLRAAAYKVMEKQNDCLRLRDRRPDKAGNEGSCTLVHSGW
jgi:hypothetical protein